MLRIEKSSSKPVYLSIRENTRMLTPTFLQALSVAFALHAFALILFHVQPFRINQTNTQFPPVQVNIEIAQPESAIFAELEEKKTHQTAIPEPEGPQPLIPYLSLKSPNQMEVFTAYEEMPTDPFRLDFHDQLIGSWIRMDDFPPSQRMVPFINIRGPLADRPIVAGTIPKAALPPKRTQTIRLLYTVKVDDETGRIFWFHPEAETLSARAEETVAEILETIKFEPAASGFVTQGEIELYVAGSKK